MARDVSGVELVLDTAKHWWSEHRDTVQTVNQASQALVRPLARKHPTSLVGSAAALGILVMVLKPWRLLLRRKVLFGALSVAATQALRSRSVRSWLAMAMSFAARPSRPHL